jgi:hypothetical protein
MKKITSFSLALLIASSFLFSSCKKDLTQAVAEIKSTPITVGYNTAGQSYVIPVLPTTGPFNMNGDSIYINIDSLLSSNNLKRSQIKSIVLKTITFTLVNGMPNFDFFKFVNATSTIGGTPRTFYSPSPIDLGITTFTINANNFDIFPTIDQKYFDFNFVGENDQPISVPTTVKVSYQFDINATITQ